MNHQINMKKKAFALATACVLVLTSGSAAFAATDQTQSNTSVKNTKAVELNLSSEQKEAIEQTRADSMKEALAQLVSAGTITQSEADKMPACIGRNIKASGGGILASLTEEQRKALETERQTVMKEELASLVSAGTITQEQVDKMGSNKKALNGSDLTDAQKTAIREAEKNSMTKAVANLVSAGTITQSVADQLNSFPENKSKESDSKEKVLTEDQMKALQSAAKTLFESKLASLVSAGTITQAQSDFFANDKGFHRFGDPGLDRQRYKAGTASEDKDTSAQ